MVTDGDGNLCWQAAFEQEIASLAVGIRSFPKEGLNAEKFLRDAYIAQLTRLGGQVHHLFMYYKQRSTIIPPAAPFLFRNVVLAFSFDAVSLACGFPSLLSICVKLFVELGSCRR